MLAAPSARGEEISDEGNDLRSSPVTPWVAPLSDGSPYGVEPSGSRLAARCPYRRMECASLTAPTARCRAASPTTAAGAASVSAGGVQVAKRARASASTVFGSFWYR